jgi:hypothetical protein
MSEKARKAAMPGNQPAPAAGAVTGEPVKAPPTRHGVVFFLVFFLPLILLFVLAVLKNAL